MVIVICLLYSHSVYLDYIYCGSGLTIYLYFKMPFTFYSPGCGSFYDAAVANDVRKFQNGRLRHTESDQLRDRYAEVGFKFISWL